VELSPDIADDLRRLLRSRGLRPTRGRLRLLSLLRAARRPLSHGEILRRMRGQAMDRVSVYRALQAFVRAGLLHRAYLDERTWTFETPDRCGPDRCHPHFTCRRCEKVTCLTQVHVPLVTGLPRGWIAERQKVHIEGLCPACAASGRASRSGKRAPTMRSRR